MGPHKQTVSFCDLPPEVILVIAAHIQSERDINFLSQSSRLLHQILNHYLYARNSKYKSRRNALIWAATRDKNHTARLALQHCKNLRRTKPLLLAAKYGSINVVKLLVSRKGVNLEARVNSGLTPLGLAVVNGHVEIIKLLLEAGAHLNLNICRPGNFRPVDTLLCLAVRHSPSLDALHLLLERRELDINEKNIDGYAPLHLALMKKDINRVQMLLEAGADPDIVHHNGETPLIVAARLCNAEAIELLLKYGANPGIRHNDSQLHPLFIAVTWGHTKAMEALLGAQDVGINYVNNNGMTALCYAIDRPNPGQIPFLLLSRKDLDPNLGHPSTSAISLAISRQHLKIASALLADPRTNYHSKVTGLVAAVKSPAAADLLKPLYKSISADLNINEEIEEGNGTLLIQACSARNTAAVKLLLEDWGADPNERTPRELWPPIYHAIEHHFVDGVRLLVATGKVDADRSYSDGDKPLLQVIRRFGGYGLEIIKILVEEGGANPNALPNWRCPLSMILTDIYCVPSTAEAVRYLLGVEGIDLDLPDKYGSRPLDYAREFKNQECIDLIEAKLMSMGRLKLHGTVY